MMAIPSNTLFILSRDDFADDMPPLNTEAGQRFVNRYIEAIGGADLVIFDNIQALLGRNEGRRAMARHAALA